MFLTTCSTVFEIDYFWKKLLSNQKSLFYKIFISVPYGKMAKKSNLRDEFV